MHNKGIFFYMIIVVQEIYLYTDIKKTIILNVALSGIDYLLLYGVKITHSTFCISLLIIEESTCNIDRGSLYVRILIKTKLIIDENVTIITKNVMCKKYWSLN